MKTERTAETKEVSSGSVRFLDRLLDELRRAVETASDDLLEAIGRISHLAPEVEKAVPVPSARPQVELAIAPPVLADQTSTEAPPPVLPSFERMAEIMDFIENVICNEMEDCSCTDIAIYVTNNGNAAERLEGLLSIAPVAMRVLERTQR